MIASPYELFERLLPDFIDLDTLKRLAGADMLNMTRHVPP
jgi:hypothetical protein